jgi:hypothetical protein
MPSTRVPESCAGLDPVRVERELDKTAGNVVAASRALGVKTHDLRLVVRIHPRLLESAIEAEERRLDKAQATLIAALRSEDKRLRLRAAAFILRWSEAGRRRMGW